MDFMGDPRVDSALHVIKGAIQKVLGAELTTSVYVGENKGRITVEYGEKPVEEQIKEIEELANRKIQENVPIEVFEMDREEAEAMFGRIIYDKFSVPPHVRKLKIVQIKDWNINCCAGEHVKTTGEIGRIKIRKVRARQKRGELEISFEVE